MKGFRYICEKCGFTCLGYYHESPNRGSWATVRCPCGNGGTSWDKGRFMCREGYAIPGFTREEKTP